MTHEPDQAKSSTRSARHDAIAIIGMSCRLPQAPTPDAFWRLLHDGQSAITEVPADRWDPDSFASASDRAAIRHGGFLDRVDGFDPAFFGISPREAVAMDPQQRLVAELSWEALENAGIVPATLSASRTEVFLGAISNDYATSCTGAGRRPSPSTPWPGCTAASSPTACRTYSGFMAPA
jgi:acyl transferase domain-containing protein